jgi:hypothetical protein
MNNKPSIRKPLSKYHAERLIKEHGIDNIRLEEFVGYQKVYTLVLPNGDKKPINLGKVPITILRWYKTTLVNDCPFWTDKVKNIQYFKLEEL